MTRRDDGQCWLIIPEFPNYETDGKGIVRGIARRNVLTKQTDRTADPSTRFQFYRVYRNGYAHRLKVKDLVRR